MGLANIVVSFFERTSVRGVPRIVRHKTWFLRLLWLIGVLTLLGIAISQAISIISEYLKNSKVTLLKEENVLSTFQNKEGLTFPSITVCNLNPLASNDLSDGFNDSTIMSFAQYGYMIEAYLQYVNNPQMEDVKTYLRSTRGYYEYIGAENATKMGHRKHNLFAQCDILFQAPSTDRFKIPCNYSQLSLVSTPEFFNCYTASVDLSNYTDDMGMPTGLSLILHLDDGEELLKDTYDENNDNTQSVGIRVSVHTENSAPDLWYSAVDISPGGATQVMTRYSKRTRLGHPYGVCRDASNSNVELFDLRGNAVAYTALGCMSACTMNSVLNNCHCIDPSLLVIYQPVQGQYVTCGDSHNLTAALGQLFCSTQMKKLSVIRCESDCQPDCKEVKYSRTLAAAKWPKKSQHLSFYERVIKDQEFGFRFEEYQTIIDVFEKNGSDEASEMLDSMNLIERSFVKINMYLEDMTITHIKESPKVSLASVLSQVGGVLNLYIGISLVLVVEVLELFYHLLIALFSCGQKDHSVKEGKSSD